MAARAAMPTWVPAAPAALAIAARQEVTEPPLRQVSTAVAVAAARAAAAKAAQGVATQSTRTVRAERVAHWRRRMGLRGRPPPSSVAAVAVAVALAVRWLGTAAVALPG